MSNTDIWDALGKTDPKQTKAFNRSGGFKGTAVKPIWIQRRLTEQFGPAGIGWGANKPEFQVVVGEGETLVYCTVSCWHGNRENVIWGVGGDKVVTKRNDGKSFHDDEAFKKAFTDAVGNAFKSIGVAADIHMGRFDDDKYVQELSQEFADKVEVPEIVETFLTGLRGSYADGDPAEYWAEHWPSVPQDWRAYALDQKEQIKTAHGKVAMLRAG